MAETFFESQYLHDIAQRRYPDLSEEDAFIALHRDVLGPVIGTALDAAEIGALFSGNPGAESFIRGCRKGGDLVKKRIKSFTPASQPLNNNITAEAGEIPAQRRTQIEDLGSATPSSSSPVAHGVETAASLPGDNLSGAVPRTNTTPISGESLLYRINYLECWNTALRTFQVVQAHQAIKALNVIADHLGDRNCVAVSGAGGPDGFARPVYDFVNMKINNIDPAERKNHRFFIYHDSTNWHPAFDRLTRERPLPTEFVNKPTDNLDHVCLFMRAVKQELRARDRERGKTIVFHLLIPSWSKIRIKEPLHFPEDLYPLQIEGVTHGGKEQVELNLPAAPTGLLHGVANVPDDINWIKIATIFHIAFPLLGNRIYESLSEEEPRVLGSNGHLSPFYVPGLF